MTPQGATVFGCIDRFERTGRELSQAITRGRDDKTVEQLDRELEKAFREIAGWVPQSRNERNAIIDFALDHIERHVDCDTSLLHFTALIRKTVER